MFSYVWPIGLIVLSNTVYQICAKSTPSGISPFISLTVTYLVGAAASFMLYLVSGKGEGIVKELGKLNWAPFVLGIVIVGLEAGYIFAYRAGWKVSTAAIVQSSILGVALIFVGWLIYKEKITWNVIVGIVICLVGLGFINYKK